MPSNQGIKINKMYITQQQNINNVKCKQNKVKTKLWQIIQDGLHHNINTENTKLTVSNISLYKN